MTGTNSLPNSTTEPPFNPDLVVVDSHIHLWNVAGYDYFAPDYLADIRSSGHRVESSVYVECDMTYATSGPPLLRPAAETAYAVSQGALSLGSDHQLAGAILGSADLRLGLDVRPLLEAHVKAGKGRFRGIRYRAAWDPEPAVQYRDHSYPDCNVLREPKLLDGVRCLADMGLTLGMWALHPQLDDVAELAAKVPHLRIAMNHMGGPIGIGSYAARRDDVFKDWSAAIYRLAEVPNVMMQICGAGISRQGYDPAEGKQVHSSDIIVADWQRYVDVILDAFGPMRSIFGSNFPVDRRIATYGIYLNAFKKMIAHLPEADQRRIFSENAKRFFQIT